MKNLIDNSNRIYVKTDHEMTYKKILNKTKLNLDFCLRK